MLLRGLLQGLGADRGRLGVRGAQARLVLLLLTRGLGARRLRLLERLLDGGGPLLHLREEGLVEEPLQDDEQDEEVDDLDDQRPVEADEAALVSAFRRPGDTGALERAPGEEQGASAHDPDRPVAFTPIHNEALPRSRAAREGL